MRTFALAFAAALMLTAGGAYAAETKSADATAKPAATTTAPKAKAERSEKSKKCSADADAKGLHGKPRKQFRKACMKAA